MKRILFLFILVGCDTKNSCSSDSTQVQERVKYGEVIYDSSTVRSFLAAPYNKYEYLTIDGMPCIRWIGGDRGGLTCNWNMYHRVVKEQK
jgi:hypothetical protein